MSVAVRLAHEADLAGWRAGARAAMAADLAPEDVTWRVGDAGGDLFATPVTSAPAQAFTVPRRFVELADSALLHQDTERFSLMYRLLWRLRCDPGVLTDAADPDIRRAEALAKAVHRDIHKTHAFLRFKEIEPEAAGEESLYLAWFEPSHHTLEASAPFFRDRFTSMRWAILTPERSARWDGTVLSFGPGATRDAVPAKDRLDAHWRAYYRSIFNPARVKIKAMTKEMPKKYWRNMLETREVTPLLRAAGHRSAGMVAAEPTPASPMTAVEARRRPVHAPLPRDLGTLAGVHREVEACRRCPIGALATQCVFGEGPPAARLMIVGEQPGDREDLAGKPFVGPAGKVLDAALSEAGIDRSAACLTNAVKHFKYEPRGKRRQHKTPSTSEIDHCRWWLDQERALVKPKTIVALGASAARGVLGQSVKIGEVRGRSIPLADGAALWVTVHPSYLLRLPDDRTRAVEMRRFVDDLRGAHHTITDRHSAA